MLEASTWSFKGECNIFDQWKEVSFFKILDIYYYKTLVRNCIHRIIIGCIRYNNRMYPEQFKFCLRGANRLLYLWCLFVVKYELAHAPLFRWIHFPIDSLIKAIMSEFLCWLLNTRTANGTLIITSSWKWLIIIQSIPPLYFFLLFWIN